MCNVFCPHQTSSDQIWEGGTLPRPGGHSRQQCGGHCDQPVMYDGESAIYICVYMLSVWKYTQLYSCCL